MCWAKDGWRSCYGKNVKLDIKDGDGSVLIPMHSDTEPHYIVKPHGDISKADWLVLTYRVIPVVGQPVFYAADAKNNTTPAIASAVFQRKGDDMYAKGNKQYYRWWSVATAPVQGGMHTLRIPLDAGANQWLSVFGGRSADKMAHFDAAKKECRQIGVTFGGGGGRGHGVRVRDGEAIIQIVDVRVE